MGVSKISSFPCTLSSFNSRFSSQGKGVRPKPFDGQRACVSTHVFWCRSRAPRTICHQTWGDPERKRPSAPESLLFVVFLWVSFLRGSKKLWALVSKTLPLFLHLTIIVLLDLGFSFCSDFHLSSALPTERVWRVIVIGSSKLESLVRLASAFVLGAERQDFCKEQVWVPRNQAFTTHNHLEQYCVQPPFELLSVIKTKQKTRNAFWHDTCPVEHKIVNSWTVSVLHPVSSKKLCGAW